MTLPKRIELFIRLGNYFTDNSTEWQDIKANATRENPWFTPEFIELSVNNIVGQFLQKEKLSAWVNHYHVPNTTPLKKIIGLVMAGNIPLVGFHDFLCGFISGHRLLIKLSSKDKILLSHIVEKMVEWDNDVANHISFAEILQNCDVYIATGSNNSSRYFDYYFSKYPHIIRRNRTSAAVLEGNETNEELEKLADDIQLYFGLGCRNVTKIYVPNNYNFTPLLNALKKYDYYLDYHKYKHNFDYQLTILIMNNAKYFNSGSAILTENTSLFSPISQIYFEYYDNKKDTIQTLKQNTNVQCIVAKEEVNFGTTQSPSLMDYADGIDTMAFIKNYLYNH